MRRQVVASQERRLLGHFSELIRMSSAREIIVMVRLFPSEDRQRYTFTVVGHRVRPYPENSFEDDASVSEFKSPDYFG